MPAREARAHRLLREHDADGEVLADIAQEGDERRARRATRSCPRAPRRAGHGRSRGTGCTCRFRRSAHSRDGVGFGSGRARPPCPLGSPMSPVPPPTSTIGRWPASWTRRSSQRGRAGCRRAGCPPSDRSRRRCCGALRAGARSSSSSGVASTTSSRAARSSRNGCGRRAHGAGHYRIPFPPSSDRPAYNGPAWLRRSAAAGDPPTPRVPTVVQVQTLVSRSADRHRRDRPARRHRCGRRRALGLHHPPALAPQRRPPSRPSSRMQGTKVYDDNDELITEFHVERRIFVPLAHIPQHAARRRPRHRGPPLLPPLGHRSHRHRARDRGRTTGAAGSSRAAAPSPSSSPRSSSSRPTRASSGR